jgi:hypothetical protein
VPEGAALYTRRKADGKVYFADRTGKPLDSSKVEVPEEHLFNARQIDRELSHPHGSMFSVFVVMALENATAVYELYDFQEADPDSDENEDKNYNNWMLRLVPDEVARKVHQAMKAQAKQEEAPDG